MIDRLGSVFTMDGHDFSVGWHKLNEVIDVVNGLAKEPELPTITLESFEALYECYDRLDSYATVKGKDTVTIVSNYTGLLFTFGPYKIIEEPSDTCPACNGTGKKPLDKRITEEVAMERALANEKDLQKTYSAVKNCCWVCKSHENHHNNNPQLSYCQKSPQPHITDQSTMSSCNGKDFQLKKELAG